MTREEAESYLWQRIKLWCPEKWFDDEMEDGTAIRFNDEMIKATKESPRVEVLGTAIAHDGTFRLRARFSDGQIWTIIPGWFDDEMVLFI